VMCGVLEFQMGSFRVSATARRGCHFSRIDSAALHGDPSSVLGLAALVASLIEHQRFSLRCDRIKYKLDEIFMLIRWMYLASSPDLNSYHTHLISRSSK
jgi:hypothetical protein